jgi:F-type H+-transporting ATPase subunit delta
MNDQDMDLPYATDVAAERIGRVYAEALLTAAQQDNQAQEIQDELEALVGQVLQADGGRVERFLASSVVGREQKSALIRSAFSGRCSDLLTRFLLVLNDHDRLDILRPITAAYKRLLEERTGKVRVYLASAVPLADDQLERIRNGVRERFQREPVLMPRVDPDLIGGLMLLVGNQLYDASVRTRLETMRKELIERSSHEIQIGRNRFSADSAT